MSGQNTNKPAARLILPSQLTELGQVWPWVEALAAEHKIPETTLYAIHLCLEEALSNIIRHGYRGEPGHTFTIDFTAIGKNQLAFTIEDHAPPFNPISQEAAQEKFAVPSITELRPGGKGIPLLRMFSDSLVYEQMENGNRLTVGFSMAQPKTEVQARP